jgi:hypothetical protein
MEPAGSLGEPTGRTLAATSVALPLLYLGASIRLNVFGITPDGTLKQKYEVATNWLVGRTELV